MKNLHTCDSTKVNFWLTDFKWMQLFWARANVRGDLKKGLTCTKQELLCSIFSQYFRGEST